MLLVSNNQSNELNYGAQLLLLVFITVKPTSSYAVVFQSQKKVQYYLSALEIHSISGAAGTTWHQRWSPQGRPWPRGRLEDTF